MRISSTFSDMVVPQTVARVPQTHLLRATPLHSSGRPTAALTPIKTEATSSQARRVHAALHRLLNWDHGSQERIPLPTASTPLTMQLCPSTSPSQETEQANGC